MSKYYSLSNILAEETCISSTLLEPLSIGNWMGLRNSKVEIQFYLAKVLAREGIAYL
jgi:hypothetical protein